MTNKLACDIVRDLLPLYVDDVVSATTKNAVSEHLEGCEGCKAEYDSMMAALPAAKEETSKNKFADFMKKRRTGRIIASVLLVALTCSLLVGGYCLATQVPIVNVAAENIVAYRTYRFESENGPKFFVLFNMPLYEQGGYIKTDGEGEDENGRMTLAVRALRPIYATQFKDYTHDQVFIYDAYELNPKTDEITEYDVLTFNGQVIWTKEENAHEAAPDYVKAFYDAQRSEASARVFYDTAENIIGIMYEDDHRLVWDLDGKLLADDYPDENGKYPEY